MRFHIKSKLSSLCLLNGDSKIAFKGKMLLTAKYCLPLKKVVPRVVVPAF